ncbi:MAG: hypothetical protein JO165_00550, partial [Candidatus Eremiobacteraeota bacterium]|nr:hypothetical protein [Candidatus Eremiobacteraeota bacterium]
MARVRRKATAKTRLNFEIAGIAAIGIAVLLGIALVVAPSRAGIVGSATAHALHVSFGAAAPLFPVLVALIGIIVFLEINVPRLIATFGTAAAIYFLLIDTAFAARGGAVGSALWWAMAGLAGTIGARIVLVLVALLVTVWITNVSVKKVIGWIVLSASKVELPKIRVTLPQGPSSVREAFALPAAQKRPRKAEAAATPYDDAD